MKIVEKHKKILSGNSPFTIFEKEKSKNVNLKEKFLLMKI